MKVQALKHHDSKIFIEYSNDIDDIYENIDEYNKKCQILIVFDMMAGMLSNKKVQLISFKYLSKLGS